MDPTLTDGDWAEALYRSHADGVWRYAARRCRNADEAADVVSATFLAAVENRSRFEPRRGSAAAWLLGIAAHKLADHRRQRHGESRALASFVGREHLPADEREAVDQRIDAARRGGSLMAAVNELPPSERELILLVALDELTPTEAARVVGIHPAAARMRLARARRRLAAMDLAGPRLRESAAS